MSIGLSLGQRARLKKLACIPARGEKNEALEAEIRYLHEVNPQAFHNDDSLGERVFYHQPTTNIPYNYYIIAHEKEKFLALSR